MHVLNRFKEVVSSCKSVFMVNFLLFDEICWVLNGVTHGIHECESKYGFLYALYEFLLICITSIIIPVNITWLLIITSYKIIMWICLHV